MDCLGAVGVRDHAVTLTGMQIELRSERPPVLAGGDDPELATYPRIEERELEAGGLN